MKKKGNIHQYFKIGEASYIAFYYIVLSTFVYIWKILQ